MAGETREAEATRDRNLRPRTSLRVRIPDTPKALSGGESAVSYPFAPAARKDRIVPRQAQVCWALSTCHSVSGEAHDHAPPPKICPTRR
jgi:hypothetical protein